METLCHSEPEYHSITRLENSRALPSQYLNVPIEYKNPGFLDEALAL
jgi:hypothetical protein